ncbi:hypothetical protein BT69DRAFT_233270 [Atractiella rhizophila]|nr:hypothetical protein BT69DRAFT_233270 [Atractiella rhizophila]
MKTVIAPSTVPSLDTAPSLQQIPVFDVGSRASNLFGMGCVKVKRHTASLTTLFDLERLHCVRLPSIFTTSSLRNLIVDETGGDGGLFVLSSGEEDALEMDISEEGSGKGEEDEIEVSNEEVANMLPTKTFKKSWKRSQIQAQPVSTMTPHTPLQMRIQQRKRSKANIRRRAIIHNFFNQVSQDSMPKWVRKGHVQGDKYYQCNHCDYMSRVTKASHNNYSVLENHLKTAQNHKGAYALYQKFRLIGKREVDISQEDIDKVAGRIPITEADREKAKL